MLDLLNAFQLFKSLTQLAMRFFCAITALALAVPLASALPKITRKGRYLYDESGARFYIKVGRYTYSSDTRA